MAQLFAPERYRFGLAAGGIVLRGDTVLLTRIRDELNHDIWVAPGGGLEEGESLDQCAERETREETGLAVKTERLVYVQEFIEEAGQTAKLWFLCTEDGNQKIIVDNPDQNEQIFEARFLHRDEMDGKTIYPEALTNRFWQDRDAGFPRVEMLGPVDLRSRNVE